MIGYSAVFSLRTFNSFLSLAGWNTSGACHACTVCGGILWGYTKFYPFWDSPKKPKSMGLYR